MQPQNVLGFGINNAVSGRGLESHFGSEVWWDGPDGSRVLFIYLKRWYCNGLDMPTQNVPPHYWDMKQNELQSAATTSHLLLMNGCDHTSPDPNVGSLIATSSPGKNMIVVHSNMDDYVELVQGEIEKYAVPLPSHPSCAKNTLAGRRST